MELSGILQTRINQIGISIICPHNFYALKGNIIQLFHKLIHFLDVECPEKNTHKRLEWHRSLPHRGKLKKKALGGIKSGSKDALRPKLQKRILSGVDM